MAAMKEENRRIGNFDELIRAVDAKQMMKCSLPFVYKLAETGRLPHVRIDATSPDNPKPRKRQCIIRFKKSDVIDFINSNYQ